MDAPPAAQPDVTPQERERFNIGLIASVFDVLENHGYQRPTEEHACNRATGGAVSALLVLVETFEGKR